jgi:hypothetical protein
MVKHGKTNVDVTSHQGFGCLLLHHFWMGKCLRPDFSYHLSRRPLNPPHPELDSLSHLCHYENHLWASTIPNISWLMISEKEGSGDSVAPNS